MLAYGVVDSTSPPATITTVERVTPGPPSGGVVVMSELAAGDALHEPPKSGSARTGARSPTPVADAVDEAALTSGECFFVGVGIDGLPGAGDVLEVDAFAAAELVNRVYILDRRGLNRVREAGKSLGSAADIDQLLPFPRAFLADDATSNALRLLAVGCEQTGELALAQFDGVMVTITPLTKPGAFAALSGTLGPARAAIHATEGDRFIVALRDDKALYLGLFSGPAIGEIRYTSAMALDSPVGRPLLARSKQGIVAVQEEQSGSAPRRLRIQLARVAAEEPPRIEFAGDRTIELRKGEKLSGFLPRITVDGGASLLVSGARTAREVSLDDAEPEVPVLLAAWNVQDRRFEWPLLVHLTLFMIFGFVGRRPPILKRVFVYRPAAFLRRIGAFLIDGLVAAFLAVLIMQYALGEPELELIARSDMGVVDPLASSTRILETIVFEGILIFTFVGTMISALFECLFGRSIGKRIFSLRVVSLDGDPPSVGAVMTRMVMLFVDIFPLTGFIGILFAALSKRRQRLGDLFAGVVVVDDRSVIVRPARPEELKLFQP